MRLIITRRGLIRCWGLENRIGVFYRVARICKSFENLDKGWDLDAVLTLKQTFFYAPSECIKKYSYILQLLVLLLLLIYIIPLRHREKFMNFSTRKQSELF